MTRAERHTETPPHDHTSTINTSRYPPRSDAEYKSIDHLHGNPRFTTAFADELRSDPPQQQNGRWKHDIILVHRGNLD